MPTLTATNPRNAWSRRERFPAPLDPPLGSVLWPCAAVPGHDLADRKAANTKEAAFAAATPMNPARPPTATLAPAITPPAARPAVRSAVHKANQCSRSPSAAMAKISGA
jgi:hypothetical protein